MSIIDKPSDYFETKLYTGTQQARNITGLDFAPNWVWIKKRTGASGTSNHYLFDSVRGASKTLFSNATNAEDTNTNSLTAFNSDGFSLGNDTDVNVNNGTFVSWNWKAGASFTNDASGTGIGSIDSAGSFNNDAGFSIVSYTNTNQSANSGVATIKHGLNTTPNVMILKDRDATSDWSVYHSSLPTNKYLALNKNDAGAVDTNIWNNTAPTSTVFTVGDNSYTNPSNRKMIGYIFAEKKGYSKFGSYTGNGNADGTFVYTGFKPAYVMIKNTSATQSWLIYDNKISPFNVITALNFANSSSAEDPSAGARMDIVSNGFKLRVNHAGENGSGSSYIYMAFAEAPLVGTNNVPCTAR